MLHSGARSGQLSQTCLPVAPTFGRQVTPQWSLNHGIDMYLVPELRVCGGFALVETWLLVAGAPTPPILTSRSLLGWMVDGDSLRNQQQGCWEPGACVGEEVVENLSSEVVAGRTHHEPRLQAQTACSVVPLNFTYKTQIQR